MCRQHRHECNRTNGASVPLVDGLLILLVGLDKPLANANEAAIHEAALQQVVDGFKQQSATLVGKAILPQPVVLGWKEKIRKERHERTGGVGKLLRVFVPFS